MQTVMGTRPPPGLAEPALTSTHQSRGTTLISFDQPNPNRELVYAAANAIRAALPEDVAVECPTWDALLQLDADRLRNSPYEVGDAITEQFQCHRADIKVWRHQIGAINSRGYQLRIRGPTGVIKRALNAGTLTLQQYGDSFSLRPVTLTLTRGDPFATPPRTIRFSSFCMECGDFHKVNGACAHIGIFLHPRLDYPKTELGGGPTTHDQ